MNKFALQLNVLTNTLKDKLPPTDSRLRPDVKNWEDGKHKESTEEKERLEINQRNRKKILKEQNKEIDFTANDHVYYSPKYFKYVKHPITGDMYYEFLDKNSNGTNYWVDREKGNWDYLPKIYDDECKPFLE